MTDHYVKSLLGDHEQILLVTRQHWFRFFRSIVFELVFALVIIVIVTLIWKIVFATLSIWIGYFLLIIPLVGLLQDYVVWSNRQYIITNRRVMQLAGVFNKSVTDSSLEKVNDIKMNQSFFGRIFNFGDVEILTGSELGANLFQMIGDPVHFKITMLNAKEGLGQDHDQPMGHRIDSGQDIPALINELDLLRQKGILTPEEFQKKKADLLTKL